jgi:hypothetical protein
MIATRDSAQEVRLHGTVDTNDGVNVALWVEYLRNVMDTADGAGTT